MVIGKDGDEGVDGAGLLLGNADVVRMQGEEIVRMQGELDKLWKAQAKFVGQFNKLTAGYGDVARTKEEIIDLRTENQRLIGEINRVVDFVNKQDREIEEISKDAANLWHYHNEHAERLDGLWNAWNDITTRLDGV